MFVRQELCSLFPAFFLLVFDPSQTYIILLAGIIPAILITVILILATISIMSHKLGLETGLSVALFPLVIMTMGIEHMSVVWEERGPAEAFQEGAGTLVIAALAHLVMSLDVVEHTIFVFPELLFVVLAATLLLGRYSGYRLLELIRFRALGASPKDIGS